MTGPASAASAVSNRGSTRSTYLRPWRIDITDRHGSGALPASGASLARVIVQALRAAGAPSPASVGLVLSDDAELADLNVVHLDRPDPTDVLSFPLLQPEAYPPHPGRPVRAGQPRRGGGKPGTAERADGAASPAFVLPVRQRPHLGDIVVSVERAIEQANAGRGGQTGTIHWEPADELRLLVTHGTLHLCGWDHADPVEGKAMRALERDLLGHFSGPAGVRRRR